MSDYQYTDQQLNNLNRDEGVYSVNPKFAKRKDLDIVTDKPDEDLKPGEVNKVETPGQQFQVIKVDSDPKTGFDGMAVAPIINDKPNLNHVAIVVAGTDPKSKDLDISVPFLPPIGMGGPSSITAKTSTDVRSAAIAKFTSLSPQYDPAEQFLNTVRQMPGLRVTKLTGYSQGAFVIKLGAKYGISTTTFNAWFKYSSLTPGEMAYILMHPDEFLDYGKNADDVVVYNDFNTPSAYGQRLINNIRWVKGSSHKIEKWYFDPVTGRTLDKKGGAPVVTPTLNYLVFTALQMDKFKMLKSKWKKSGGKLSKSEKIFLDAVQAQMLGTNMAGSARSGADEAVLLQAKAVQEVKDTWDKIDFTSYTELSPSEVEAAFASHGITQNFISDFQTDTQKVVEKMTAIADQFDTLKGQLDKVITSLEETDTKLAGDFNAWEQGM